MHAAEDGAELTLDEGVTARGEGAGQTVGVAEMFTVPAGEFTGATAEGPGGFTAAGLVCNCRCATVPVIEEAA